jgi:DNA-binding LytR/AlgR family response regulator
MNHGIAGALRTHPTRIPELKLGLGAWVAFILATCAYCLTHQALVSAVTPDPARTLTLALREWGAWALLAPVAMRWFQAPGSWRDWLRRALWLAAGAASLPIAADLVTGDRSLPASIALFWPRNIAMAAAMALIARVFAPASIAAAAATSAAASIADSIEAKPPPAPTPAITSPDTLLVSKGANQCVIRVDDIQHVSAAGNYVEICANDQRYLLRATFGEFEASLPPGQFARIHRSHIVRLREIERIRVGRSGSGTVHLRNGAALALSRGYRAQLKARHETPKSPLH